MSDCVHAQVNYLNPDSHDLNYHPNPDPNGAWPRFGAQAQVLSQINAVVNRYATRMLLEIPGNIH